ncbi:MAG: DUF4242 domain-containing protein [Dehalococcoidia bacterium]|nr:DUF4242 domain-containing protein [Dehalococcoidia bacterium]
MGLYKVRRVVGELAQDEVDAAALRSTWCLSDYPNVTWHHSMWDKEAGEIICLYEAPNEEIIREHAEAARLPCDEVREVSFIDPQEYLHG